MIGAAIVTVCVIVGTAGLTGVMANLNWFLG